MPIPLILYGDGPRLPTGLARIARDLATRLVPRQEELGIRFAQVGVDWPGGWHWQPWDFCGFQPSHEDQGREAVGSVVEELQRAEGERPIVLMIMDPARCFDLLREERMTRQRIPAEFWGYFPIDAMNREEAIGGPAGQAVRTCDRVLGYGRWGAGVLKRTLTQQPRFRGVTLPPATKISYLPHGIDTRVFHPDAGLEKMDEGFRLWSDWTPDVALQIGCVATNQARKDLGLYFSILAELKSRGWPIRAWLHTDKLTHIWDVGELARTCGLQREEICVSMDELTDQQLAARYAWSDITIAPGLGEGFGYPIVESLACGTPVLHGDYAGGAELIPDPSWRVEAAAWRLESLYALQRPVFDPRVWADRVERVLERVGEDPARMTAYCAGSVAHLEWEHLWPRWQGWIEAGLRERREMERTAIAMQNGVGLPVVEGMER